MSRNTKWERLDSDLWRLREAGDRVVVLVKHNAWMAYVEVEEGGSVKGPYMLASSVRADARFELCKEGLQGAKDWAEKIWEGVKG